MYTDWQSPFSGRSYWYQAMLNGLKLDSTLLPCCHSHRAGVGGHGGVFWPPHRGPRKQWRPLSTDLAPGPPASGCGLQQPHRWWQRGHLPATGKHLLVHKQHCVQRANQGVQTFFFVLMQGEHVESCHLERPHQPTVLCWHPTKPVLALGWENGDALLLTHPSGDQTAFSSTHSVCITLLEWSSSGSRLVTGDQVSFAPDNHFLFFRLFCLNLATADYPSTFHQTLSFESLVSHHQWCHFVWRVSNIIGHLPTLPSNFLEAMLKTTTVPTKWRTPFAV